MYSQLQRRLVERVRDFLRRQYEVELNGIVVEQPPKVELGEYALPLSFELAKKLRKAPRKIAEEIVAGIGKIDGFEKLEVAGAGYINARLTRNETAAALTGTTDLDPVLQEERVGRKILVEHTSINPNKAAHIGHLRNAILGDTFVRLLSAAAFSVDVQNYIDNTGVQVADVVVGFVYLEKMSKADIIGLIERTHKFDFYCWDLYARVSSWYEEDKANLQKRLDTLHAIEHGGNELAEIAELISTAILKRHLETMDRLGIEYDFLPRESEILSLKFWELAFEQMKQKGVLYFETEGKNKGCWVMRRPSAIGKAKEELTEDDTKVIVRSNGTVGYVGKDIAYHLWKFGLLGRDFGYCKFYEYPNGKQVWISAKEDCGDPHPHFGGVWAIYNVIDARQSEPQNTVVDAIRELGYEDQASHYTHFSYEMVALTPRCASELGYTLSEDEWGKSYIEVSGRRGFGVKADDLLDKLIGSALKEVDARHPELSGAERRDIATQIAVGALRYFMLKFTKNSVIAFDFKDALSFEGETGPYAQYAVVRATNIFRKAGIRPEDALGYRPDFKAYLSDGAGNEIWELWLAAAKTTYIIEQCISTTEPAFAAKHAFNLAQLFNNFYHRHHILTEADEDRKRFLLATAAVVRRELIRVLGVMGITVPPVM
ncbi:MAG TPA: arginine--tRNA ligase [Terriglobales bacterium]|nr:arginine--tRNA ligase [Terriglobales bacterium]